MDITVIIPTLAEQKRFSLLIRAVDSVRASSKEPVQIVAVVNGHRKSEEVCTWLEQQDDVKVVYQEEGSAPLAHLTGRKQVTTRYFCFLDDDDEFTEGALDQRKAKLAAHPEAALVVTNGVSFDGALRSQSFDKFPANDAEPLRSLMAEAWLHNCNHLFSTEKAPVELFEDYHPFMEWTWLAFKIGLRKLPIVFFNTTTFVYNDTAGSLSKSDKYFDSEISLLKKMAARNIDVDVEKLILNRLSRALHSKSERALYRGSWGQAFRYHLSSLLLPGGLDYLLFSRYFFNPKFLFMKPLLSKQAST